MASRGVECKMFPITAGLFNKSSVFAAVFVVVCFGSYICGRVVRKLLGFACEQQARLHLWTGVTTAQPIRLIAVP